MRTAPNFLFSTKPFFNKKIVLHKDEKHSPVNRFFRLILLISVPLYYIERSITKSNRLKIFKKWTLLHMFTLKREITFIRKLFHYLLYLIRGISPPPLPTAYCSPTLRPSSAAKRAPLCSTAFLFLTKVARARRNGVRQCARTHVTSNRRGTFQFGGAPSPSLSLGKFPLYYWSCGF